jgi:hypothetical protein
MSVPIKDEFFKVPGENRTAITKHVRIKDNQVVISADEAFFTKGIKLAYDTSYPQDGTTVTFQTDGSITSITSPQVTFTQNGTEWTAQIPPSMLQDAVTSGKNVNINFNVAGPGGVFDPEIRVTPF